VGACFPSAAFSETSVIDPESGVRKPHISRASVLFPEPFAPRIAVYEPFSIEKEISRTALCGESGYEYETEFAINIFIRNRYEM